MAKRKGAMMSQKDWEDQMKQYASQQGAAEVSAGGNQISKKNSKFTYQGASLGKELSCVILAFNFENAYYDTPWDPDEPQPPSCFAIASLEDDLAPHENSTDPQADACAECWANEWESADTGRGKACKNSRRLALLEWDDEIDIAEADVASLRLSPTEVKNWRKYVKDLENRYGRPTFGVVTNVYFEDSGGDRDILNFEMIEAIEPAEGMQIMERLEEAEALISEPYRAAGEGEEEPAPRRAAKKKAKKKVAKKAAKKKSAKKKAKRKSRLG